MPPGEAAPPASRAIPGEIIPSSMTARALATAFAIGLFCVPAAPGAQERSGGVRLVAGGRRLGLREGLPSLMVRALLVGRDGTLWAGTDQGLARIASGEVETLRPGPDGPPAVTGLAERADGRLLVVAGHRRLLAGDGLSLRPLPLPAGMQPPLRSPVAHGDGTLLLSRGRPWLLRADGSCTPVSVRGLPEPSFLRLAPGGDGLVWGARPGEVVALRLSPDGTSAEPLRRLGPEDGLTSGGATGIVRHGSGVAFSGADSLLVVDGEAARRVPYPAGLPGSFHALASSPDGELFLGCEDGVYRLDAATGGLARLAAAGGLGSSAVLSLAFDRRGNLWIGTHGEGLGVALTGSGVLFVEADGAPARSVVPLGGDRALVSTGQRLHLVRLGARGRDPESTEVAVRGAAPRQLLAALAEEPGAWLVGSDRGVLRLGAGPAIAPDPRFAGAAGAYAAVLLRSSSGTVWAGTSAGLFRLEPGAPGAASQPLGEGEQAVFSGLLDARGRFLTVGDGPPARLLAVEGSEVRTVLLPGGGAAPDVLGPLPGGRVLVAFEDGTRSVLDPSTGRLAALARPGEPLATLLPASVAPLPDGRLAGVAGDAVAAVSLDPPGLLEPLLSRDELDDADLATLVLSPAAHGLLWAWTLGRVALWRPVPPPPLPPLGVTARRASPGSWPLEGGLRLPPVPSEAELRFSFPDPAGASSVRFRWRLAGEQTAWGVWDASDRVRLASLSTGRHVLEVDARDSHGRSPAAPARFVVEVAPRFFETGPFRASLLALVALLSATAWRLRTRALVRRAERLERAVAERTLELADANERLREASLVDPLTGLRNRRYVAETVEALLSETRRGASAALREGKAPPRVGVVLADVDRFKSVNDRFGHGTGDEVLKGVAASLRAAVRGGDVLARWGGEELLVLARVSSEEELAALLERLRAAVEEGVPPLPGGERVTASLGASLFPPLPARPELLSLREALALSDAALYEAKRAGRNRWRVCRVDEEKAAALVAARGTEALASLFSGGAGEALAEGVARIRGTGGTEAGPGAGPVG